MSKFFLVTQSSLKLKETAQKEKENHHSIIIISSKILFKNIKPSKLKCRLSHACVDTVTNSMLYKQYLSDSTV